MARIVTAEDLRSRLGRELDELRDTSDALYVSKRGRLAAVVLDSEHYAGLVERLEFLEDSLAALTAREEADAAVAWSELRDA
jgi:prevent-host-death family protein